MGSTRLPGKVMKPINGRPMIDILLTRLARATEIDDLMVATSDNARNHPLVDHLSALRFPVFCGSENDVLDRFLQAARGAKADIVVRITGDCPLVDPVLVDDAVRRFRAANVDYLSNTAPATFPDGLDIEVFRLAALETAALETDKPYDREHVTPYLRESGRFSVASIRNAEDLSGLRWTVDEPEDFDVVSNIFAHFAPNLLFGWGDVLAFQRQRPEAFANSLRDGTRASL
jgi:glutamate-1-semialdehyde 2,1-aminomutase